MITDTCTMAAEITGRHMMAEAQYLLNMISFRFLRTTDVLYSTKLAGGQDGFVGLMFDAVDYPTTPVAPPHSPSLI